MAPKHRRLATVLLIGSFVLMGYSLVKAIPVWFTLTRNRLSVIQALIFSLVALISFSILISSVDWRLSDDGKTFIKAYQEAWTNLGSAILIIVTILSFRQIIELSLQSQSSIGQGIVNQFFIASLIFIGASTLLLAIITKTWRGT